MWRLVACWITALAAVAGATFCLASPVERPRVDFSGVDIAVIGTSISRNAYPPTSSSETILGDGRSHLRIGMPFGSPEDIENLFEQALDDGVQVIIIEANPFIFAWAHQVERFECTDWECLVRKDLRLVRRDVSERVLWLLGRETAYETRIGNGLIEVPGQLLEQQFSDHEGNGRGATHRGFPLHVLRNIPDARLRALVARAHRDKVEVIMAQPPRSMRARAFLGQQESELRQDSQRLADALHVPLFLPEPTWDDSHYIDWGHLNGKGRQRFLSSLRDWYQRQQSKTLPDTADARHRQP